MKNITLSADERLIEQARARARQEHTTLNEAFRSWLEEYTRQDQVVADAIRTLDRLRGSVDTGGKKFTREEMNER